MMLGRLTVWDMKFQIKYGFYLLYSVLTVIYLIILLAMPESWRTAAAAILIFSDPAAMGLFFMGAIVLLEKSQKVPCAYAVTPVRAIDYIGAKVISLCTISIAVAAILAVAVKAEDLPRTLLGTALSGAVFTLLGIIIATKISSLNQFILWTVPIEVVGLVPAILHMFGVTPAVLRYYPLNVCMDMIAGKKITATGLFVVVLLIAVLIVAAHKCVRRMWKSAGGIKL